MTAAPTGLLRAFRATRPEPSDAGVVIAELAAVFAGLADIDPAAFAGPWFLPMEKPSHVGRRAARVDPAGLAELLAEQSPAGWAQTGEGASLYLWRTSVDGVDLDVHATSGSTSPWTRDRFIVALPPATVDDVERCRRLAAVLTATWPGATIDAFDLDRAPIPVA